MRINKMAILSLIAVVLLLAGIQGCTTEAVTAPVAEPLTTTTAAAVTTSPDTTENTPTVTPELLEATAVTAPETPVRSMTPEENFLAKGVSNFQNLNSYQYDLKMDMSFYVTGDQAGYLVMNMSSTGGTDKSVKTMVMKMLMTMNVEQTNPSEADNLTDLSQNVSYDIYELGDFAYIRQADPLRGDQWVKYSIANPDKAFDVDVLKQQTVMLDSPSEIKIIGSEIINGYDCFILSVKPDMKSLAKYLNEQESGQADFQKVLDYNDVLQNYSILCWVGKDSDLMMRMSVELTMKYDARQAGLAAGVSFNATTHVKMVMTMTDFNKPFSVTLPPEANNAKNGGSKTL